MTQISDWKFPSQVQIGILASNSNEVKTKQNLDEEMKNFPWGFFLQRDFIVCLGPEAEWTDSGSAWTNTGRFLDTHNGS